VSVVSLFRVDSGSGSVSQEQLTMKAKLSCWVILSVQSMQMSGIISFTTVSWMGHSRTELGSWSLISLMSYRGPTLFW
jgi:hypothetical protein